MSTTQHILDHRRVQTAVIGHENSDLPVILPMDAHELDLWRKAHPGYSYWCGHHLGGCGGELSDRRYTEKVCHFAHHPSAPSATAQPTASPARTTCSSSAACNGSWASSR